MTNKIDKVCVCVCQINKCVLKMKLNTSRSKAQDAGYPTEFV